MNKALQIQNLRALAKSHGVADDLIDWEAEVDASLTFPENKNILLQKIMAMSRDEDKKFHPAKVSSNLEKFQAEQAEAAERELEEAIESIKNNGTPDISRYYTTAKEYVRTLLNAKHIHALILEGETGLGKSYVTLQTLAECGLKLKEDFIVINSHVTPLELYQLLHANADKVVVFDDVANLFESLTSRGILLSALWNPTKRRVVSYFSTTDKLRAPPSFVFTGKLIVLTNTLPREIETIKSRCFHLRLSFSFEERVRLIYEICKLNNIPMVVPDFIKEHATPAHALNFRLPFKVWEVYQQNQNNGWEKLALQQMEVSEERAMLVELLKSGKTVKQQVHEWAERTGLSRATYFRYKREMESQSHTIPSTGEETPSPSSHM
ncbi:MAG: hypothetical protein QXQ87_04605 [Halobacteria archaeon]